MEEIKEMQMVVEACNHLKSNLACDFVGLALQNEIGPDIQWHYASGNLNDKYKRITVRYGKGIAGKILSTGSTMMIQDFPNDILGKAIEYPIMLAEKLVSAYGVPLFFNSIPKGVLVIGNRARYHFTENEQENVRGSALLFEEILKGYIKL